MKAICFLPLIALASCIFSIQTNAITRTNDGVTKRARIRYNGESCSKSVQCFSYNCEKAHCRPKKDLGTACYKDANCLSGFCGPEGTCLKAQASSSAAVSSTIVTSTLVSSSPSSATPTTNTITVTVIATATTTISTTTTITTTTTASPSSSTPPISSEDHDGTSDDGEDDDGNGGPVSVGSGGPTSSSPVIGASTLQAIQSSIGFLTVPTFTSVFNILPGGVSVDNLLNNITQKMKDTVSETEKAKIQQDQDAKRSDSDTKAAKLARQQEIQQLQSLIDLLNSNPIAGLKLLGKY